MTRIDQYLTQCQVPDSALIESATHTPPSPQEVQELIAYLRSYGVKPVVVGSVGILHHLTVDAHKFRPTVDLDLFVNSRLPEPPEGWHRDSESIGVTSWISPTGGYVDFLEANHEFPGGHKNPASVASAEADHYPVATPVELLKLKLNSFRMKDLSDAVALAKATGVPPDKAFGRLNAKQKENLALVKAWVAKGGD